MYALCHSTAPRPRFIACLRRSSHSRCSLLARMGIPLQDARMPYLHVPSDVMPVVITNSSSSSSVISRRLVGQGHSTRQLSQPQPGTRRAFSNAFLVLNHCRWVECWTASNTTRFPAAKAYPASAPPIWRVSPPPFSSRPRARGPVLLLVSEALD